MSAPVRERTEGPGAGGHPPEAHGRRGLLPDEDAFVRGMWPEGLVAALATLAVAWPLTTLLRDDGWVLHAVLMVALVAVSGAVLRTLDVPPSFVALGQLVLGLAGIAALYLRDTLWRGVVPTGDTLERVGELLRQAGTVLQTYAAPAPTTEGVTFLIVSVITLTAVSVDSMGVTGRAPASAGLPLAAAFLVSVSNTGAAMEPWFFVAVAALWLIMLAQQAYRVTTAWPSANRQESRGGKDVSVGPRSARGLAQLMTVGTLVAAVLGAAALPHLPPTFFSGGLARNPDARTVNPEDGGDVAFTESMDPTQDLRNRSRVPVLTYRTNALSVQPLRVTATETYEDGRWVAPERLQSNLLPPGAPLPPPEGVSQQVELSEFRMEAVDNSLQPPHLAAPSPLIALDVSGGTFRYDPTDLTVVLQGRAPQFSASYLVPTPGAALPEDVGSVPADPAAFDPELLSVDEAGADAIAALSAEVVGDTENSLDAAILMQEHLRDQRVWTYSLELDPAARIGASDPITGFLESKRGYCVQFAQTMVMMARHEGIPARMAVGFLPGSVQPDGTRQVIASDAHTWPELWISGMGWTRFEPTPGARTGATPPPYTRGENDSAPTTTTATQQVTPTVPEPTAAPSPEDSGLLDDLGDLLPTLGRVLLVVLALALLMTLMPWVGRRYRESELRAAGSADERVEGHWTWLTRSLQDLGIGEPPPRSPRVMRRHYVAGSTLGDQGEEALGRVTATLERTRYGAPGSISEDEVAQMGEDAHQVLHSARHTSPWNLRANARLVPHSGVEGLKAWARGLFRR